MTVWVEVEDRMQRGYRYALVAPEGREFDPGFRPELAPAEMLALGVFFFVVDWLLAKGMRYVTGQGA